MRHHTAPPSKPARRIEPLTRWEEAREASDTTAASSVRECVDPGGSEMIWLLVAILLLFAIGGGIFLSKFLFIVLIIAIAVAVLGRRSTA
jgi:hypothetical protein